MTDSYECNEKTLAVSRVDVGCFRIKLRISLTIKLLNILNISKCYTGNRTSESFQLYNEGKMDMAGHGSRAV
jgi:hypothetical protein